MRKIVEHVNGAAPCDPVNLQVGTVPVTWPGSFHQGDLHQRQGSITRTIWASPISGRTSGGSLTVLGWAYIDTGRWDEALDVAAEAAGMAEANKMEIVAASADVIARASTPAPAQESAESRTLL